MNTLPQTGKGKRILLVTSNYPRWKDDTTTPFVLHLAQDLNALGWDIDVLAPHAAGTANRETLESVPVSRFRYWWPENQQSICYQGGALINLRSRKSNYFKLPALVLFEWLSINRRLIAKNYSLIHSHWILPQGFVASLACKFFPIPHITTVHGSDVFALKGKPLAFFKRFAMKHADAVTVNSSATKKEVLRILPSLESTRLVQIPMGVNPPSINEAESGEIRSKFRKADGPLLVFVGRLVEEKGIGDLLQALASVVEVLPSVSLMVIGEGQDKNKFVSQSQSLNLEAHCHFLGWITHKELPNYLYAADIFVSPSHFEAHGLSIIEAMFSKTPVIAAQTGGVVDSVKDQITGLLVAVGAKNELSEAIVRLARNPELGTKLSEEAFRFVSNTYSRDTTAGSFSRLFNETLDGTP